MKRIKNHNTKAFSLVEMVAASTILSLGVITLCSLSVRNVTRIHDNQKEEMAWDILDRQMAMIDYVGIDSFVQLGQLEGTLGSGDSPLGEYQWQAVLEEGDYIGLYEVAMVISWGSERHKQSITASTMFLGAPAEEEEEEGDQQDQQGESATSGQEGASGTAGTTARSGGGGFSPGSANRGGGGPGGGQTGGGPGGGRPGGEGAGGGTRPGGRQGGGETGGGGNFRPGSGGAIRPGGQGTRPGGNTSGRTGRSSSVNSTGRSSGGGSGGRPSGGGGSGR
ncbi:MAG: hypothetical protein JW828_08365 [Sedimentisphaerales bacterium]|nr:hypothetical protein [Sedimentisphaerales bacterium]